MGKVPARLLIFKHTLSSARVLCFEKFKVVVKFYRCPETHAPRSSSTHPQWQCTYPPVGAPSCGTAYPFHHFVCISFYLICDGVFVSVLLQYNNEREQKTYIQAPGMATARIRSIRCCRGGCIFVRTGKMFYIPKPNAPQWVGVLKVEARLFLCRRGVGPVKR